MKRITKYLAVMFLFITVWCVICFSGCASCDRAMKDCSSNVNNGIPRIINIYTYDGELLVSYEGKIDVETNDTYIVFHLDGKRYIYYTNMVIVEVLEVT